MMRRAVKRFFLGSDEMVEDYAEKFAKTLNEDFDDMKEASLGLYHMPSRLEKGE